MKLLRFAAVFWCGLFCLQSVAFAAGGEARSCLQLFEPLAPAQSGPSAVSLRVGMAQTNGRIGDFQGNLRQMVKFTQKAAKEGVEILVFPELSFTAYPVRDLVERKDFVAQSEKAVSLFIEALKRIPNAPETIFLGSITRNPKSRGHEAQNSLLVIHKGKVVHSQVKRLLPNTDIFDESRNFEAGKSKAPWKSPWGNVGCAVCEDSWFHGLVNGRNVYQNDPADKMAGVKFAVNVSASPYYDGKRELRQNVIGSFARKIGAPVFYVNQVGAHDEIIFDGTSTVYDSHGQPIYAFKSFVSGLATFNFTSAQGVERVDEISEWQVTESGRWSRPEPAYHDNEPISALHDALILGIRDYFKKTGFKKAVLGLSGGIDSAVTAVLLVEALGKENVLGVLMPGPYSSEGSITDAQKLAANLGIETVMAPITSLTTGMLEGVKDSVARLATKWDIPADEASEDNIQARLRMINVMYFANKFGMLAICTTNKSEMSIGQSTLYADSAGAIAPIGDVFKTVVYKIAYYINGISERIPSDSLTKAPSAELAPGQTDEAKFGPFKILDPVLKAHIEQRKTIKEIVAMGYELAYVRKTIAIYDSQEHKRRGGPIVLKVSEKSYGSGRKIPISKARPK